MDRYGWLKAITQFSNVCGASRVNNKILFFGVHDSHFNDGTLIQMMYRNIQPFGLKSGNSTNKYPNDNWPNGKLKSLYNLAKSVWMLKYGATKFSPRHMNSVFIESWDYFNMSDRNIIRDSFAKKRLLPLSSTNLTTNTQACAASVQVSYVAKA